MVVLRLNWNHINKQVFFQQLWIDALKYHELVFLLKYPEGLNKGFFVQSPATNLEVIINKSWDFLFGKKSQEKEPAPSCSNPSNSWGKWWGVCWDGGPLNNQPHIHLSGYLGIPPFSLWMFTWVSQTSLRHQRWWPQRCERSIRETKRSLWPANRWGEGWHGCLPGKDHQLMLVVSTHLKNISQICQIGSFPQVGVKIKNIWNHHLAVDVGRNIWLYYCWWLKWGW